METIIPITDLQQKTRKYVQQVRDTGRPIIITQRGRAAVVMMTPEMYQSLEATLQVMTHPDWQERMARAERDSRAGRGVELGEFLKKEARRRRRAS